MTRKKEAKKEYHFFVWSVEFFSNSPEREKSERQRTSKNSEWENRWGRMEKRRRRDLSRSQTHIHANDKMNETCQTCRRREKLKGQKIKTKLSSEMKQRTATAKTDIIKFATEKKRHTENATRISLVQPAVVEVVVNFASFSCNIFCFFVVLLFSLDFILCAVVPFVDIHCIFALMLCIKKKSSTIIRCAVFTEQQQQQRTLFFFSSDTNFTAAAE